MLKNPANCHWAGALLGLALAISTSLAKRYERHPLGLRSVFNGLVPRPTTTRVRVRELGGGCSGRKKGV